MQIKSLPEFLSLSKFFFLLLNSGSTFSHSLSTFVHNCCCFIKYFGLSGLLLGFHFYVVIFFPTPKDRIILILVTGTSSVCSSVFSFHMYQVVLFSTVLILVTNIVVTWHLLALCMKFNPSFSFEALHSPDLAHTSTLIHLQIFCSMQTAFLNLSSQFSTQCLHVFCVSSLRCGRETIF